MPTVEKNKEIAGKFFSNISSGDMDALIGLLSDDVSYWVAGSGSLSGMHDKAAIEKLMPQFSQLFPDGMKLNPLAMTAEGDRVAVEAKGGGKTGSGKAYANRYHFLFEINDAGKIKTVNEYMDTAHVIEVFGP